MAKRTNRVAWRRRETDRVNEVCDWFGAMTYWLRTNQLVLTERGTAIHRSGPTQGLPKNSITAEFHTEAHEATVQLWDTGESDFFFWDKTGADEVAATHHCFTSVEALYEALNRLLARLR